MSRVLRRVIKLGGSLLDLDDLADRIRRWLASQPAMQNVMIVGGGRLADGIRDAFASHKLSEEAAHWLCIRILGVTAELVARILPDSLHIEHFEQLQAIEATDRLIVFETERWLRGLESSPGLCLPHTWDVTSDSIAARLASALAAEELVLLKSSAPPEPWKSLRDAADAGYLDRHFPIAAEGLQRVRFVDLRSERAGDRP